MSERRRIFAGAAFLSVAQVAEQACVFARNLILARLLGPENMGVAATFAVTMSLLEMSSELATDRLLLQAKDGDDPALQGAAQLVEAVRGALIALVILALSGPIAALFDVPEAVWAFRALALAPLIKGFAHLDAKRLVRGHRYRPLVLVDLGSQALVTAAAWPLAWALDSYWAVLWLVIGQVCGSVLISHVVATRRYGWSMTGEAWRRIVSFGWPLLINGLLMFGVFQGDRLIVGVFYDMETLGVYSVAFALAMMPTMMLARVATPVLLPSLSRLTEDPERFAQRHRVSLELLTVGTLGYVCLLVGAGGSLMALLYGDAYRGAGAFIGAIALMQALRMVRIAPTLAAMAHGDTRNALIANLWRTGSLALALFAAAMQAPLVWVALAGVAGEVVALLVSVRRLMRRQRVPLTASWPLAALPAGALVGLVLLFALSRDAGDGLAHDVVAVAGAMAVGGALMAIAAGAMPGLRSESVRLLTTIRERRMATTSAS